MDFWELVKLWCFLFAVVYSSISSSGQKVIRFNINSADQGCDRGTSFRGFYFRDSGPLWREWLYTVFFCKL